MGNAPRFIATSWRTISKIALTPETAAKVQIATPGQNHELLRKYLPDETIPGYLGGALHIDGDPSCRTLIAPGGGVPEEVLQQFQRLMQQTETCAWAPYNERPVKSPYLTGKKTSTVPAPFFGAGGTWLHDNLPAQLPCFRAKDVRAFLAAPAASCISGK